MSFATQPSPGLIRASTLKVTDLATFERMGSDPHGDVLLCIHGTLDRGLSFRRIARRLSDLDVVAYDRRGYQESRSLGAAPTLRAHLDDVAHFLETIDERRRVFIFGHSFGGVIALAAALEHPERISGVIAYEPPLPWMVEGLHPHRGVELDEDASEEAERFFRRIVSDAAWERLSEEERDDRRADGAALIGDLRIVRMETPFTESQLGELAVPLSMIIGTSSHLSHTAVTAPLAVAAAPHGQLVTIEDAGHGAHLSHPDALARRISEAVAWSRAIEEESTCAS